MSGEEDSNLRGTIPAPPVDRHGIPKGFTAACTRTSSAATNFAKPSSVWVNAWVPWVCMCAAIAALLRGQVRQAAITHDFHTHDAKNRRRLEAVNV